MDEVDGEVLFRCYKCEGKGGFIGNNPSTDLENPGWYRCSTCQGAGMLDWIENAMGGKQPLDYYFGSGSSGTSHTSSLTPISRRSSFFKKKEYYQRRKSIYKGV